MSAAIDRLRQWLAVPPQSVGDGVWVDRADLRALLADYDVERVEREREWTKGRAAEADRDALRRELDALRQTHAGDLARERERAEAAERECAGVRLNRGTVDRILGAWESIARAYRVDPSPANAERIATLATCAADVRDDALALRDAALADAAGLRAAHGGDDFVAIDALIRHVAAFSGRHRDHVRMDLRSDDQCPSEIRWIAALEPLEDNERETWARGGTPLDALSNLLAALTAGHRGEIMADGLPRDHASRAKGPVAAPDAATQRAGEGGAGG